MDIRIQSFIKLIGWAALSGVLLLLSYPGFNLFYFAWVAFIPLIAAIETTSITGSFMLGFTAGLSANIGMLYWIYPMILFNTGSRLQALICIVAISSYMAIYYGIWAADNSICFCIFSKI